MCTNISSCGVRLTQIRFPVSNEFSNSATLAKSAYHSVAPGVGGASQCKGFDTNYEDNSQRENITWVKKSRINFLLRHSQTNISVFQRRTLTPSSPPVRLHTSFAFHSQAVYHERETEKKRSSEYYILVIFSCSALSEPQVARRAYLLLNYYSWGLPPRRKLRLHKARVQDPAASRTLWVGGTVVLVVIIVIICDL